MSIQATLTTTIRVDKNVNGIAFSPDGRLLALATDGERVPVVEVATGRERLAVRHGGFLSWGAWGVVFSPDGRWLATCGAREARIWDADTGKQLLELRHKFTSDNPGAGHPRVQAVAFSPDGPLGA